MIRALSKHRVLILLLGLGLLVWSFTPGSQRLDQWLYAELTGLMPAVEMPPVNTLIVTLDNKDFSYSALAEVINHLRSAKVAAVGAG